MPRVHIPDNFTEDGLAHLRSQIVQEISLTAGLETDQPSDFDILVTGFPTESLLEASPNLRALIVPFAGVPAPTRELLTRYPHVAMHNLHYNVAPTAETTMALLLAAVKFVPAMDRELRANDWRSRYAQTPVTTLRGRTALILGYGHIGRYLAPICQAFGMTVVGIRRDPPMPGDADGVEVYPPGALDQLLPRAEVLINVLPLTPETEGLIGAKALALLPDEAVLVNVGRGGTVDEEALYRALTDGRLRAAAIDVWYNYPREQDDRANTPPSRFPFHELDNVVMSPHRAGYLSSAENKRMEDLAVLLNIAATGEPMPNLVDPVLGY